MGGGGGCKGQGVDFSPAGRRGGHIAVSLAQSQDSRTVSLKRENRLLRQLLQLIGGFLDLPTEKERRRRQLRRREGGNKKKVKEQRELDGEEKKKEAAELSEKGKHSWKQDEGGE